jgi:hypothetical protein
VGRAEARIGAARRGLSTALYPEISFTGVLKSSALLVV